MTGQELVMWRRIAGLMLMSHPGSGSRLPLPGRRGAMINAGKPFRAYRWWPGR